MINNYMKPLYTVKEFNESKWNDKLPLECSICHSTFYRTKTNILRVINKKEKTATYNFCSQKCNGHSKSISNLNLKCEQCGQDIVKNQYRHNKNKHYFCSQSCSTKYMHAHRKWGCRRSKLEKWIEEQLIKLYPNLEIHFNRKDTINSELDIYIPSLKLAFELNGIFHYEPIYGESKLSQIQNNDNRKFQACLEKGIELCIIDTSSHIYYKKQSAYKFLSIITNIINNRLKDKNI